MHFCSFGYGRDKSVIQKSSTFLNIAMSLHESITMLKFFKEKYWINNAIFDFPMSYELAAMS